MYENICPDAFDALSPFGNHSGSEVAIIRTRITWMAMAMILSSERSHRAAMFPQNICKSEKGPPKVSFIHDLAESDCAVVV